MAMGSVSGDGVAGVVRRTGLDHPSARGRGALAAGVVAVAFGGAYVVGTATKPTAASSPTPQLAPGSTAAGSKVSVVALAPAASVPSLAHVVKPRVITRSVATKKVTHVHHTAVAVTHKHVSIVAPVRTVAPVKTV